MEHDAIYNGPGSLGSVTEIKILICYILKSVNGPVPETVLTQLLHYEGIANYFEVASALSELLKTGMVSVTEKGFTATERGAETAETLRESVPKATIEKAIKAVTTVLTRLRREKETNIKIDKASVGFDVTFSVIENGRTMMKVTLNVPDKLTADYIKDRVLNDPSYVYAGLFELVTDKNLGYKK